MIAQQLNNLLLCLSHREPTLQDAAFHACEIFIRSIPSSLCHHLSLYTLLDMLTALFDSILDSEAHKFEPRYEFKLKHSKTTILVPSSSSWRATTLSRLHKSAKEWVRILLNRSNQDTKILLQSYISDLGEYSRLNSVEFGVSFAMDMAGLIYLQIGNYQGLLIMVQRNLTRFLDLYLYILGGQNIFSIPLLHHHQRISKANRYFHSKHKKKFDLRK